MRSFSRTLCQVLFVALVLRAGVAGAALAGGTPAAPDTAGYLELARSMLASGRFDSDGAPELVRTPSYPLLLAIGEGLGSVAPVTLALQVVLGALTVWLVARLALALGAPPRVALLAAGLYAVEPLSLCYTGKLLTETLFTALFVGMLLTLARWAREGHPLDLAAAGVLLAAGYFVRPVLYLVPPVLAVVIAAIGWHRHRRGLRVLAETVLFLTVAAAPFAGWRARNAQVGYDGFSAITDVDLFYYRAAGVVALRTGEPLETVQAAWRHARDDTLRQAGRTARGRERAAQYREMRAAARAVLVSDPGALLRVTAAGAGRTVLGPGTTDWAEITGMNGPRARPVLSAVLAAYLFSVLLLAALGLRSRAWNRAAALPALAASIYLVAVTAGAGAYSRFRHPVMPSLCILAAVGAQRVRHRSSDDAHNNPAQEPEYHLVAESGTR